MMTGKEVTVACKSAVHLDGLGPVESMTEFLYNVTWLSDRIIRK